MTNITLKDKSFSLSIPSEEIQKSIARVAEEITRDMNGKTPVFLVILNGAFMFASDLIKKLDMDCEVSFVKLASYSGTSTTNQVKQLIGLNEDLKGRHVVILEDIIDTGITMEHMLEQLNKFGPADIRIATFLLKPDALIKVFDIHYVGIRIPNDFIVGYGLDYDGLGRNLKDVYKIIPE
jgi:hypoxanthine phosphoribosyltransferase